MFVFHFRNHGLLGCPDALKRSCITPERADYSRESRKRRRMEVGDMWTVVYISPSRGAAEELKRALGHEGILATIRPLGLPVVGEACNYEVLVLETEAEEAQEMVSTVLQKLPE